MTSEAWKWACSVQAESTKSEWNHRPLTARAFCRCLAETAFPAFPPLLQFWAESQTITIRSWSFNRIDASCLGVSHFYLDTYCSLVCKSCRSLSETLRHFHCSFCSTSRQAKDCPLECAMLSFAIWGLWRYLRNFCRCVRLHLLKPQVLLHCRIRRQDRHPCLLPLRKSHRIGACRTYSFWNRS